MPEEPAPVATVAPSRIPLMLALVIVLGFFGTILGMMFKNIPEQMMTPLNIMIGALNTSLALVLSYYFGSSAGSAQKTELLGAVLHTRGKDQ